MLQPISFITQRTNQFVLLVFLIITVLLRILFWQITNTTLEDALITFRYAENIAQGHGFVYNIGERVLGTTTPLWTIILASLKIITNYDLFVLGKVLGIIFDCLTLTIVFLAVQFIANRNVAIIFGLLFSTSPDLIMISTSGMETSLLLLGMGIGIYGLIRNNSLFGFGLIIALLTRIDAVIFVSCMMVAAFINNRRWALNQLFFLLILVLPWFVFSFSYFGNILPQSLQAKFITYHNDVSLAASSFIRTFMPFVNQSVLRILFNSITFVILCLGIVLWFKKYRILTTLAVFFVLYCLIFSISGKLIFYWYLIPVVFISVIILAFGIEWLIEIFQTKIKGKYVYIVFPLIIFTISTSNFFITYHRLDKYKQLQALEDELRKGIGLWLKQNIQPGSSVFLEPIGYIGYYASSQIKIIDEIGIVTPKIIEYRKTTSGWYYLALEGLSPDYLVQYKFSLDENKSEGTNTQLFKTDEQKKWFLENYQPLKSFKAVNSYPLIEEKEKEYILFKKSR